MKSVKSSLVGAVMASLVAMGTSTYAVPTVWITDSSGDSEMVSSGSSVVTYDNTSLGVWNVAVNITAISGGSGTSPSYDLNVVASANSVASGAPYSLTVWFSDTGLGPTTGSFLSTIGGTTAGSVTYKTYADLGNSLFGTSLGLTSQSFGATPFSGSQSSASGVFPFAYSLTQEVTIDQIGSGLGTPDQTTSLDATLTVNCVPEGGMTLVLLGSSLIALWAFGRFSKSIRA